MLNQLNSLAVLATRHGTDLATYLSELLRLLWLAEDIGSAQGQAAAPRSSLQVVAAALECGQPSNSER